MTLQECYTELGGNYEEVISRLRSDRLVQKFIIKFLSDGSYELLCESLEKKAYEEAFRAAHTIKGICQNLGFSKLLESSSNLTEALRHGQYEEAAGLAEQVGIDYKRTQGAILKFQEAQK